jgi:hypothetical protein
MTGTGAYSIIDMLLEVAIINLVIDASTVIFKQKVGCSYNTAIFAAPEPPTRTAI